MSNNEVNERGELHRRHVAIPIVLMLFAMPFAALQYNVPTILMPLIADVPLSAKTAPWLITMFTLTSAVMALVAGPLAKRIGVRPALGIAVCLTIVGALVGMVLGTPFALVVSRGIEGIGFAIVCVAGPLAIDQLVPERHQGLANGIWGAWIPLGAFCGEVLSPIIYASALGFVGVWGIFTVPIVLLAIVVITVVQFPQEGGLADAGAVADQEKPVGGRHFGKSFILFLVAWLSFNLLNFAIMSYGPTYLQSIGMDAAVSGLVTTIPMLMSLVTGPIGGFIIDKFGHAKQVLMLALLVNTVTTVVFFTQRGAAIWIAVIAMGLLATLTFVATLSSISAVIEDKGSYANAVSIYMFVQCGGELVAGLASPLLLGIDLDNWSLFAAACCAAGLIGLLCAAFTNYRK